MKSIKQHINEALRINSKSKVVKTDFKYFPKTKYELKDIIKQRIESEGNECDLNDIDTSKIIDMSRLFYDSDFNGDISCWDVSNVKNMSRMFSHCKSFNKPLDNWNVSNVENMGQMFECCESFNQPLNNWDVSKVTYMLWMFNDCKTFNQPLNNWNVSNVYNMKWMFKNCKSFNQDISKWDVSNVIDYDKIFDSCPIEKKYKPAKFN